MAYPMEMRRRVGGRSASVCVQPLVSLSERWAPQTASGLPTQPHFSIEKKHANPGRRRPRMFWVPRKGPIGWVDRPRTRPSMS